ncbi:MAG: hypothetical protein HC876_20890 [Chloroflexaceae bacterium]|nr:hypothetical protein [Chloroflexaceae bacterium]
MFYHKHTTTCSHTVPLHYLPLVCLWCLWLAGCAGVPVPSRYGPTPSPVVPLDHILLEVSDFPDGWSQSGINRNLELSYRDTENYSTSFKYLGSDGYFNYYEHSGGPLYGISVHDVLRYRSLEVAEQDFQYWLERMQSYSDSEPPGTGTEEQRFSLTNADQQATFCGRQRGNLRCTLVARYGTYIAIYVSPTLIDLFVTEGEFQAILTTLDTKMQMAQTNGP